MLFFALVVIPFLGRTQDDPRYLLPVESSVFFPEILKMMENEEWDKVLLSVELMEPFLESLEVYAPEKYASQLYKLILYKNKEGIKNLMARIILENIIYTLDQLKQEKRDELIKLKLKFCLSEFFAIEPYYGSTNRDLAAKINFGLRTNYNIISDKPKYLENSNILIKLLRTYSNQLKEVSELSSK